MLEDNILLIRKPNPSSFQKKLGDMIFWIAETEFSLDLSPLQTAFETLILTYLEVDDEIEADT